MPAYKVLVSGTGVWLPEVEVRWFGLRRRAIERRVGFYTTRFVEAPSPQDAETQAIELVRDQVRELHANRPGEEFGISVEELREWNAEPPVPPAAGFAFYGGGERAEDVRPAARGA